MRSSSPIAVKAPVRHRMNWLLSFSKARTLLLLTCVALHGIRGRIAKWVVWRPTKAGNRAPERKRKSGHRRQSMRAVAKLLISMLCVTYPAVPVSAEPEPFPAGAKKLLPSVPESFKSYTPYAVNDTPDLLGHNFLFLAPDLSARASVFKSSPDQDGFSVRFRIDRAEFVVSFDRGASEDPGFLVESATLREPAVLGGETLFISSSGGFYSVVRANEDFEVRRKHVIRDGTLDESGSHSIR